MRTRILQLWGRLPRPLRRFLVRLGTPSHTVGAIGVIEHDGQVLLVRLAYRRGWGLPGGLLKRGEHAETAVLREVAEEVGLAVDLVGVPTVVVEPKVRRVDVVFRCALPAGTDPASARPVSPEILETCWWPADALPQLHAEATTALKIASRLPR